MRSDYDYIRKAADICLTTTKRGHGKACKAEGVGLVTSKEEILLAVEQDYFVITDSAPAGIESWYVAFTDEYKKQYRYACPASFKDFKEAVQEGLLTIKLVIWDD